MYGYIRIASTDSGYGRTIASNSTSAIPNTITTPTVYYLKYGNINYDYETAASVRPRGSLDEFPERAAASLQ